MDVTNLKEYVYNWNTSCDVSQWRSITPKQDSWMFLQMAREAHLIATFMGSTITIGCMDSPIIKQCKVSTYLNEICVYVCQRRLKHRDVKLPFWFTWENTCMTVDCLIAKITSAPMGNQRLRQRRQGCHRSWI